VRTAQNSHRNEFPRFWKTLIGKRTEETGETNNDVVKKSSQKETAIFEEQSGR
jgi:hypothetical protein